MCASGFHSPSLYSPVFIYYLLFIIITLFRAAMAGLCTFSPPNVLSLSFSINKTTNLRPEKSRRPITSCSSIDSSEEEKQSSGGKGIFSFVTDNPSSKGAIQMPNTPAQDGNLGQMISVRREREREREREKEIVCVREIWN